MTSTKPFLSAAVALVLGVSALLVAAAPAQAATEPQITLIANAPSQTNSYVEYDGLIYLAGIKPGDIYQSLYSYDGATFTPIAGSPLGVSDMVVVDGNLLVKAKDPLFVDYVFYSFDGTNFTQLVTSFITPQSWITSAGSIYFAAEYGGGIELTSYDGTTFTHFTGYSPDVFYISEFDSDIYFRAANGTDNRLFIADPGTGTATEVAGSPRDPSDIVTYNGFGYLSGSDGTDYHLYRFDGTTFTIVPTGTDGGGSFAVYNGSLYFVAFDGADYRLYGYNSVSGLVTPVPDGLTETESVFVFDGKLLFPGITEPFTTALKAFDGTTTSLVGGATADDPYSFTTIGAFAYFTGNTFSAPGSQMFRLSSVTSTALAATGTDPALPGAIALVMLLLGGVVGAASLRARRTA